MPKFFSPHKELKSYDLYRRTTTKNERGKPITGYGNNPISSFLGVITQASQNEIYKYNQNGHPITHKVVVYSKVAVIPEDMLKLGNRRFYVQDVRDPGELGMFTCIFCNEEGI